MLDWFGWTPFVWRSEYQMLQEKYKQLQHAYDEAVDYNKKLFDGCMEANNKVEEAEMEIRVYSLLIRDCLQWMSEITLPKKTAGTADKERRRTSIQNKARELGIVGQKEAS